MEWTILDLVIVLGQVLATWFYKKYVEPGEKLKRPVRCILNRLYAAAAIGILMCWYLTDLGRYSLVIFSCGIYWVMTLFLSMMFTDGWCCEKCGRRIGLRVLFRDICPYCHK